jgi:hypothetical protein
VEPITIHRAERRPFPARIPETLWWPLGRSGILSILGLGAVLWLLRKGGLPGLVLGAGVWWGFVFNVIRLGASGEDELGPPDFSDVFSDVVSPAIRGVVATAVIWVPAVAYLATAVLAAGATPGEALRDPVVWLLAGLGVAYGPAAILVAAAGGSFLSLFNPLVGVAVIVRLGRDYWLAAVSVGALLLADLAVEVVVQLAAAALRVPFVSAWLAESAGCFLPIVAARILGVLLHVRGDALGYGVSASYLEPALGPGAVPRGAEPVLATETAPDEPVRAIDLGEPAPAPAPAPRAPAATAAARIAAAAAAAPAEPAGAIGAALAANDRPRAAALFAAYRGPDAALPARTLFEVARAAADAGQHALSARALHAAGTGADAAVAPNALLVLARVYERRLARPAEAQQVLSYLVARWPDSDAARSARESLPPAGA